MPSALSTDLYEVTMAAGFVEGDHGRGTFDLYVRTLPETRSFLVAAGLEQGLAYLETVRFTAAEVAYLRTVPALAELPAAFFDDYLARFRFTGEVWAMDEGTPVFANEPILSITAPLAEAQLVETAVLAIVGFQTSIASKAVRVAAAAAGRPAIEFGGRRAHGTEAAMWAARAAFLGGLEATSNLAAGRAFDIPVSGTMAHSWVMAHDGEEEAFRRYADLFGDQAVLLLDTYDTCEAARRVVSSGLTPAAVRLDSGDLGALSRDVRGILDGGGLRGTRILVSGDLDEYRIASLVASGAPVDGFGVGTALSTSNDAPALGVVYKLAEVERAGSWMATAKSSPGKATWAGRKQVWRMPADGRDRVGLRDERAPAGGHGLLRCVMRDGTRVGDAPALADRRAACQAAVAGLPAGVRRLENPLGYQVEVSDALRALSKAAMTR